MPLAKHRKDVAASAVTRKKNTTRRQPHLALIELFDESSESRYQFINSADLDKLGKGYRILFRADVDAGSLFRIAPTPKVLDLPDVGTETFLAGIETALNIIEPDKDFSTDDIRSKAIASCAMDAATDAFFSQMEQNIERWTYDASSKMLGSLASKRTDSLTKFRREAADIHVKFDLLNTEFRAFFIESLVIADAENSNTEAAKLTFDELEISENWQKLNIQPQLMNEYEGHTKVEYSQLNKRLNHILGHKVHADENVLGPKAVSKTLALALEACNFTSNQLETLEPIIIADFNGSLERLYKHINTIWIGLDILPDIKLEIVKTESFR